MNLWYDVPGDHSVPIEDIYFYNNYFLVRGEELLTRSNNSGKNPPQFAGNIWFSSASQPFHWQFETEKGNYSFVRMQQEKILHQDQFQAFEISESGAVQSENPALIDLPGFN